MKRDAFPSRKPQESRIGWRNGQYAAMGENKEDNFDDRVSEDIFDFEDEDREVDRIVRTGSCDVH
jgi:hypothetical protein